MASSLFVGLTGGIGAGKSTVARALVEHGALLVDGDAASRDVVDPRTPGGAALLPRIAALLGTEAIASDGSLDRAAVAARIFADDALRQEYNALLRPAILAEVARRIDALRRSPGVVVHEIPLLSRATAPLPWSYDVVVTVEAEESLRLQRLQQIRGHTADEARRRIRAQGDEADRVAVADIVLRTDGALTDTLHAADELWAQLNARCLPR